MKMLTFLRQATYLTLGLVLGTAVINAQIVYMCDPSIAASTCNYLNSTISGHYSGTFSNAKANIYITYGSTGLGQSVKVQNFVTYDQYVAALIANPNKSAVQTSALTALNIYDAPAYYGGNVEVTSALGTALGQTGMSGIMADGNTSCNIGDPGCYDAVVTITNDPNLMLYYIDQGGTEADSAYDFYTTVEHETNEVLGTSSCINTASSSSVGPAANGRTRLVKTILNRPNLGGLAAADKGKLADSCGAGVPSVVDLFRYSDPGALVRDNSLSAARGAYFSYDSGATKGARGVNGSGKDYNTLPNGEDYADFVSSGDCSVDEAVQDAEGCPGQDAGLNILNDGKGEIDILNAVGYNLLPASPQSVTASKQLIDFGKVNYPAATQMEEKLELTNEGSSDASIGSIGIVGTYGDASQFSFDSACPATLRPAKKCSISVSYKPAALVISRATLNILTTPGSTISIPLTGAGTLNVNQ